MNIPAAVVLTLPLDRICLAHLVAAGVTRAEDLVDGLSPLLLAETADAIAELKAHGDMSLLTHFVAYLREKAKVSLSPAMAIVPQEPLPPPPPDPAGPTQCPNCCLLVVPGEFHVCTPGPSSPVRKRPHKGNRP
jgi:hypothetical protein